MVALGPFVRSTGISYDIRKAEPYAVYDQVDFDIPIGTTGDNMDRYLVRVTEMEMSLRIIEQALAKLPQGLSRLRKCRKTETAER